MTVTAPHTVFSRTADDYDGMRRGLVPSFDAFYGNALDVIDIWRRERGEGVDGGSPLRLVDLGIGTGLFSAMVLERNPDARIAGLDFSEGMLAEAAKRFDGDDRVTLAKADLATDDIGGPWDLALSALAIHHLEHEAQRSLYARVRKALAPGGLFINAEMVLGPSAEAEARYDRIWLDDVTGAGVPAEALAKARQRMAFDRCAHIEDQFAWLRAAGFSEIDVTFKRWRFAVLTARV
ncbi:methyltransferase [Amorphus sp. 3PC139-8]|uniref:class I SAM-dependent methyltransferase n=1 Tax=Amorphus sp. 3PC139-8 TaxID=2735676 RepID=UPI00345C64B8